MKTTRTKELTKAAVLAALLALSAYISIPLGFTPVVLTLQTLLVNLIAMMLRPRTSFLAVLVYTLAGLAGVPVFSGGAGGPAKLFGPTGGYIMAFLAAAPAMSLTKGMFLKLFCRFIKNASAAKTASYAANAMLVGMTVIYTFGTAYMMIIMGKGAGEVLMLAVIPFIPLDILKCIAAAVIAVPVEKALGN